MQLKHANNHAIGMFVKLFTYSEIQKSFPRTEGFFLINLSANVLNLSSDPIMFICGKNSLVMNIKFKINKSILTVM